jgi:cytochrome c-type biogenesis protein CcmH
MTIFALLLAAMILVALALLLPAFRRRDDADLTDREQLNVDIARERLVELEAAHASGEMERSAFEQARDELERALAADLSERAKAERRGGKALLLALVVVVPLAAVLLYQQLGSPQFLDVSGPGAGRAAERMAAEGEPRSLEELVAGLEARLAEAPQDPEAWYMLGRSYMAMNRYQDAMRAYQQLLEQVGEHPTALVALADAIAMTQDGSMQGRPAELVQRALAVAPDDPTALWLAGRAAEEAGEHGTAVEHWMKALPAMAERPDLAQELRALIAQAAVAAGMTPEDLAKLRGMPASAAAEAPLPAAPGGKAVAVTVRVAPELLDQVQPDDVLFVFARAVAGPPMPLAVGRFILAELPDQVVLDDSSAMSPQLRISGFDQVNVQARVAKGGQPTAQSGDLQSAAVTVAVGGEGVTELVIDQRVP